jgi:hypothetical protein
MQQSLLSSADQAQEGSQALDRHARPPVISFDPYFQRQRTRWVGEMGCIGPTTRYSGANPNWPASSDPQSPVAGNRYTEGTRSDDPS